MYWIIQLTLRIAQLWFRKTQKIAPRTVLVAVCLDDSTFSALSKGSGVQATVTRQRNLNRAFYQSACGTITPTSIESSSPLGDLPKYAGTTRARSETEIRNWTYYRIGNVRESYKMTVHFRDLAIRTLEVKCTSHGWVYHRSKKDTGLAYIGTVHPGSTRAEHNCNACGRFLPYHHVKRQI